MNPLPILYSFRRCPYAMRARLAIVSAGISVEHREILLRDKPTEMLKASPKGTVPVLVLPDQIIDESYDIMLWALGENDPENWLNVADHDLIHRAETEFKTHLDKYKYASRFPEIDAGESRGKAATFLHELDAQLLGQEFLCGDIPTLPDMAIVTFVRQFAHVDLDWFNEQPWPNLSRWLADFRASDRFQAIMAKHPVWVA